MPDRLGWMSDLQVGIVVRDLEAVTPFYRDGLGLSVIADETPPIGRMRFFACGGGTLKLLEPTATPDAGNPPGGLTAGVTGLRWFTLAVSDIEAACERCMAAGARLVEPIFEWAPGTRLMVVEDPEGSCWVEVVQRTGG